MVPVSKVTPGGGTSAEGSPAGESAHGSGRRPIRPLWIVVLALLLGAALIWGGSRLVWFADDIDAGVRGTVLHTETGAQRSGALVPLAVLALAATAGVFATNGWLRRSLGVLLVLAGVAACWVALNGVRLTGYPAHAPVAEILSGRGLVVLGGLLVVVAGVLTLGRARAMPHMGAKYSAPGAKRTQRDPETELWDALSDGEDPTRPS